MAEPSAPCPSPAWKKPSDVMKVRLTKRRASSLGHAQSLSAKAPLVRGRVLSSDNGGDGGRAGKRRNPFGQEGRLPPARRCTSQNDGDDNDDNDDGEHGGEARTSCQGGGDTSLSIEDGMGGDGEGGVGEGGVALFRALDSGDDKAVFDEDIDKLDAYAEVCDQGGLSPEKTGTKEGQESGETQALPDMHKSVFLPLDWSIKSRLRFTSPHPFSWSAPLKTTEEAQGLCSFVKGEDVPETQDSKTESEASRHSRWKARLQQSLMVWSHPHLPWVKLFPRMTLRSKTTSSSFAAFDENIQKDLMASWSESFRSAFYLLRSGHCPYFYLLAHQYTVLFRAAGVGGVKHIHALFTPTTKGLREAFRDEGIEFTMPLANQEESKKVDPDEEFKDQYAQPSTIEGDNTETTDASSNTEEACRVRTGDEEEVDEEEEEIVISQDDAGASSWLQSMGLDKQSFPSLEPSKVNFQRDQLIRVDNRPESLVLVQAADTQALYNFLLNTKTTVATTGTTAGIPPTLLAPVPFQGATLGSRQWRPGVMKQAVGAGKLQESHSLDVTGPLLPHNLFGLCRLLGEAQQADYCSTCSGHEPTLTFSQVLVGNGGNGGPDGGGDNDGEASGEFPERERLSDFLAAPDKGRTVGILKDLIYSEGLYTWFCQMERKQELEPDPWIRKEGD